MFAFHNSKQKKQKLKKIEIHLGPIRMTKMLTVIQTKPNLLKKNSTISTKKSNSLKLFNNNENGKQKFNFYCTAKKKKQNFERRRKMLTYQWNPVRF